MTHSKSMIEISENFLVIPSIPFSHAFTGEGGGEGLNGQRQKGVSDLPAGAGSDIEVNPISVHVLFRTEM